MMSKINGAVSDINSDFNHSDFKPEFAASPEESAPERASFLERFSHKLLFLAIILFPVAFAPFSIFPLQAGKMILLGLVVALIACVWFILRLKDGRFVFPKTLMLPAAGLVVLISLIATLLSGAPDVSFAGLSLDVGTFGSILVMFVLFAFIPILFRTGEKIFYSYLALLIVAAVLAVFHLARFFLGAGFLSFGFFTDVTSNTIGKWNDMAVFFGLSTVLSVLGIEFISVGKMFRALVYGVLILSLAMLAIVNFSTVWYVLGLFALIFLVYMISFGRNKKAPVAIGDDDGNYLDEYGDIVSRTAVKSSKKIPAIPLAVLIISLIFIIGGGQIGGYISNKLNISQIEIRPSWQATWSVAKSALAADPIFGSGPARFSNEWQAFKPDGINSTVFFDTDFSYGYGLIPTFLATTGALGFLSWILFLAAFIYTGFKFALTSASEDKISRYLILSSFFGALFLWIFNFFYVPSASIFALTFALTGLFAASLNSAKQTKMADISYASDPRANFVAVLALIVLLIGGVAFGYTLVQRFTSSAYLYRGLRAANYEGNFGSAEKYFTEANGYYPSDVSYRLLADIGLAKLGAFLNNSTNISADAVRTQFQSLFGAARDNAMQAINLDKTNYLNWFELGKIYEAVVPLKIAQAYESASAAYNQARADNPTSPAIYLALSRVEFQKGDNQKARDYIGKALQLKNNYTDAIFLLSQIEVKEGDLKGAITSVEAASVLAPNDPIVFFQLGILRYNNKDYAGAVSALERAVALNPSYANAKYFLGLSYDRVGNRASAIVQFRDLTVTNPDNSEVKMILGNLQSGRAPFANATPPATTPPEKRSSLPIKKSSKKGAASAVPPAPAIDRSIDGSANIDSLNGADGSGSGI